MKGYEIKPNIHFMRSVLTRCIGINVAQNSMIKNKDAR